MWQVYLNYVGVKPTKIQTKVHDRLVVVGNDDDSVLLLQLTKRKELKWWIVL